MKKLGKITKKGDRRTPKGWLMFQCGCGCVKIRGFVSYSGVFDSRKFFLLLSDFDDFCGCFVILSEFGEGVSAVGELAEECFIGDIFQ